MELRAAIACCLLACGCATGAPVGARFALRSSAYAPFSPAAAPRTEPEPAEQSQPLALPTNARSTVVSLASGLVGQRRVVVHGVHYADDCVGLVRGVFSALHLDLLAEAQPGDNGVTALWRFAGAHGRLYSGGRPVAGDLVFFHDTYDLNRDGRDNDGLTHVGLVEAVEADGTVVVIHRVAKGVVRYRMNLAQKERAQGKDGRVLNDYLRGQGPKGRPQLTSELFAGYATLLPLEPIAAR